MIQHMLTLWMNVRNNTVPPAADLVEGKRRRPWRSTSRPPVQVPVAMELNGCARSRRRRRGGLLIWRSFHSRAMHSCRSQWLRSDAVATRGVLERPLMKWYYTKQLSAPIQKPTQTSSKMRSGRVRRGVVVTCALASVGVGAS